MSVGTRYLKTVGIVSVLSFAFIGGGTLFASTSTKTSTTHNSSPISVISPNYLDALRTADNFLYDWAHADKKSALQLLSPETKKEMKSSNESQYFSRYNSSFEIVGAREINSKTYLFRVWMYGYVPGAYGPHWERPAPKYLRVVEQKTEQWVVGNLP